MISSWLVPVHRNNPAILLQHNTVCSILFNLSDLPISSGHRESSNNLISSRKLKLGERGQRPRGNSVWPQKRLTRCGKLTGTHPLPTPPPKNMPTFSFLVTGKVTLFGKWEFADVIKLRILRRGDHFGLSRWSLNLVTNVLIRVRPREVWQGRRRRQRDSRGRESSDTATSHQKLEKKQTNKHPLSPRVSKRQPCSSACTLMSDLWTQKPQENKFMVY